MLKAEEWRELATEAIVKLLAAEGAATQPEMEAKISDAALPGMSHKPNPHHLTAGRRRLLEAGVIDSARLRTRGGQVVTTYFLADPSKKALRSAGRKRLLLARFHGWSAPSTEWGPKPLPQALERVIHASLIRAAPHGYHLLNPDGGEVSRIFGQPVAGGAVDNAAFYTPVVDGVPGATVLVVIEAKNVRQWIYPQTQELYQLLDKCARLQLLKPDQKILPVLVCRRQHYQTGVMAKQMGFHVIGTWRQYVRPIVGSSVTDREKFDQVNSELAFNLELHESDVDEMVNHFTKVIPKRIGSDGATDRWSAVIGGGDAADLLKTLRDDAITGADRHNALMELAEAVDVATSETTSWGPNEEWGTADED